VADGGDPNNRRGRITGIGGVFFRARKREDLAQWYHDVLGLPTTDAATAQVGETVWAAFDSRTTYFGPTQQDFMVNYRVDDLDAAILRVREAGASVSPDIQRDEYGRFAWAVDPEGQRFELWEPAEGMGSLSPGADPPPDT
jgi:predicted enzyme related to lactoylglutathione lyase